MAKKAPNTACTRPPEEHRDYSGGSLRVFRQSVWLEVGSVKVALSRPAHQRITQLRLYAGLKCIRFKVCSSSSVGSGRDAQDSPGPVIFSDWRFLAVFYLALAVSWMYIRGNL
jgi:hypothetical protein